MQGQSLISHFQPTSDLAEQILLDKFTTIFNGEANDNL